MENNFEFMIERGYVKYSDFGAVGDGVNNDHAAIYNAHVFANEHGLDVFADEGAVYYIHTFENSAPIKTNTDFSGAKFIIDDQGDEIFLQRSKPVFTVEKDNAEKVYTGEDLLTACVFLGLIFVVIGKTGSAGSRNNGGDSFRTLLLTHLGGKIDRIEIQLLRDLHKIFGVGKPIFQLFRFHKGVFQNCVDSVNA